MADTIAFSATSPTIRLTIWVFLLMFLSIVIGSVVFTTEIIATGQGRIVPIARVQTIQSRFQGKVAAIHVREGQRVSQGDALVSLEDTEARSLVDQLGANLQALEQDQLVANAVLAPLSGVDPASPVFVSSGLEKVAGQPHAASEASVALVRAILVSISDDVAQLDSALRKTESAESVSQVRLANANADYRIVADKFKSYDALEKQGVISRADYFDRLREVTVVEGEVTVASKTLQQLAAEKDEIRKQRQKVISSGLVTYQKQLNDTTNAMVRAAAELKAAKQNLANMTLVSPVDGIVENLSVSTVGGFLDEGTPTMTIVPQDTPLELEALFDNSDIGFLRPGQRAYVKLAAFPAERFGTIAAEVTGVGADARQGAAQTNWVYAVRLKLDKPAIQVDGQPIRLASGMTASVDIVTGERRLISYFFSPLIKTFQDSLHER
ncbi:HlyD family type I secretion periplasmic adaptor subunit [Rhizobium sp. CCGE 510]|uniref:HlyD family type I secretion periplasmic adaptor subunit n=1 Tax=Rhizobium sp. CCGE 510 TaxID=1132836 RepID=UPI00027B7E81|nr:HlyD family type I secretion periplasmic adaptor subunit [Rhizobium sp. CCGE 510]EJT04961.1 putative secretion membrane fusion protein [Rhizobium sp. CCGE 510]